MAIPRKTLPFSRNISTEISEIGFTVHWLNQTVFFFFIKKQALLVYITYKLNRLLIPNCLELLFQSDYCYKNYLFIIMQIEFRTPPSRLCA